MLRAREPRVRDRAAPGSGARFLSDAADRVEVAARTALAAMLDGRHAADAAGQRCARCSIAPVNTVALRRRIASWRPRRFCAVRSISRLRRSWSSLLCLRRPVLRLRREAAPVGTSRVARREGRFMRSSESPVPTAEARDVSAARLLPDRRRIPRAGGAGAVAAANRPASRCRRRPASGARCAESGTLAFTLRASADADRFRRATENDMRRLFVPFGDLTQRHRDVSAAAATSISIAPRPALYDLDFNRAYHPYCVFNAKYDCPYPPRENRLTVPIRAGERLKPSSRRRRHPHASRCSDRGRVRFRRRARRHRAAAPAAYQEVLAPLGVELTREDYYANYLGFDDAGVFRTLASDGLASDEADVAASSPTKVERLRRS